jgi:hypothetical protein
MASTRITGAEVQITGILDMRQNRLTGLETNTAVYPSADDDGASKKYVDEQRIDILNNLPVNADNGSY